MRHLDLGQFQIAHTELNLIQTRRKGYKVRIHVLLKCETGVRIRRVRGNKAIGTLTVIGDNCDRSVAFKCDRKSSDSEFILSVMISALFFLSFLFIFSAISRAFDFNVLFAFLPYHMKIALPVSRTNTKPGSRESNRTGTGSKWIDAPAACTLYSRVTDGCNER